MKSAARQELAVTLIFAAIPTLLFLDMPIHMDEAWFLALARHTAEAPFDPLGFSINLYGRTRPASELHAYGLIIAYLMAPGAALAGTRDWLMRLLYLPVELAAAGFLYAVAARFLRRPLVPTLLVLAAPMYWMNVHLLTAERWVAAFGFAGLYAAVRGAKGERGWLAASSAAFAAATAAKYTSFVLVIPAGAFLLSSGVPVTIVAAWAAGAVSPALAAAAATAVGGYSGGRVAMEVSAAGMAGSWRHWLHRVRAVMALLGGGTLFLSIWPLMSFKRVSWRVVASAAIAAALFLPWFDLAAVRPVDRLLGIALSIGPALALAAAVNWRKAPGGLIWVAWIAAVLALQGVYWSIVSRSLLFAVPPLIFGLAAAAESEGRVMPLGAAAAALVFGLALGSVDARYAHAQKDLAAFVRERFISTGRVVWYTGHWGFQHYMAAAGAQALEESTGWAAVRSGDIVVVPTNNTNLVKDTRPRLSDVHLIAVDYWLPIRVMSAGSPEAGFYSSAFGFLPFSFSREPIDEFHLIELR